MSEHIPHHDLLQKTVPVELSRRWDDPRPGRHADPDFRLIARHVSESIQKDKRIERLERDGLTGLYNRLMFDEILEQVVNNNHDGKSRIGLAVIDANKFKQVNDTYGHAQGDKLLTVIADSLAEHARESDIPFRFGGDEFVLLMNSPKDPSKEEEAADVVQSRLKSNIDRAIAEAGFDSSVSVGIAFGNPAETPEALFLRADLQMYQAKNASAIETPISV